MDKLRPEFLMITHKENHWDEITKSSYPFKMLDDEIKKRIKDYIKDNIKNVKTIFIKSKKEKEKEKEKENWKAEKAWIGTVSINMPNIDIDNIDEKEIIRFNINIEMQIPVDYLPDEFQNKPAGWYYIGESEIGEKIFKQLFYPPFFKNLIETKDWKIFEEYTYYLLKLIGINEIYKFEIQKGAADGFFKIKSLAVIYDTTLDEDFESSKEQQIENYVKQIEGNSFKISGKKIKIPIDRCRKEVWIITRRKESEIIGRDEDIIVKEVSIYTLFEIFLWRLIEKSIYIEKSYEEALEQKLRSIGSELK